MSLYRLPQPETRQGITDLIRQLFNDLSELVQQHIQLAKTELREEGKMLGKAAVFGVIGLVFMIVMLTFVGNLLILFMVQNNISLVAATLSTVVIFLLLTAIFGGLCIQQLQSAQKLLKQDQ